MSTYWLLGEHDGLQVPFANDGDLNDESLKVELVNGGH